MRGRGFDARRISDARRMLNAGLDARSEAVKSRVRGTAADDTR